MVWCPFRPSGCELSVIVTSVLGSLEREDLEDDFRLCLPEESEEESCSELSGETERLWPLSAGVELGSIFRTFIGIGDGYGEVVKASSPNRRPGESCGSAELKKKSVSCIESAISESNI